MRLARGAFLTKNSTNAGATPHGTAGTWITTAWRSGSPARRARRLRLRRSAFNDERVGEAGVSCEVVPAFVAFRAAAAAAYFGRAGRFAKASRWGYAAPARRLIDLACAPQVSSIALGC